jgi:type IV pilus assembly protein PilM
VSTINPFQRFFLDGAKFDTEYLEKIAPQASICMGLATRKVDDKCYALIYFPIGQPV